jgi:hypothetical protein
LDYIASVCCITDSLPTHYHLFNLLVVGSSSSSFSLHLSYSLYVSIDGGPFQFGVTRSMEIPCKGWDGSCSPFQQALQFFTGIELCRAMN